MDHHVKRAIKTKVISFHMAGVYCALLNERTLMLIISKKKTRSFFVLMHIRDMYEIVAIL